MAHARKVIRETPALAAHAQAWLRPLVAAQQAGDLDALRGLIATVEQAAQRLAMEPREATP
jgi:hypothetical protein